MSLQGFMRGLALGAGAMFFFDPARGRRRRYLLRDQFLGWTHQCGGFFDRALRDAGHRIEGTIAEFATLLRREEVSDDVLVERVRSRIGRYVSHPRALEVSAHGGNVILQGSVLEREVPALLGAVWGVRGVRRIENHIRAQSNGRSVAAVQHNHTDWAPSTRLFMGGVGTLLMANCLVRGDLNSKLLGTVGFGLVLTSMSHCDVGRGTPASHATRSQTSASSAESARPRKQPLPR